MSTTDSYHLADLFFFPAAFLQLETEEQVLFCSHVNVSTRLSLLQPSLHAIPHCVLLGRPLNNNKPTVHDLTSGS